jgi:hypothetical protein
LRNKVVVITGRDMGSYIRSSITLRLLSLGIKVVRVATLADLKDLLQSQNPLAVVLMTTFTGMS